MGPMMEVPSWNSRDVHDNHENLVDWLRDTVKSSKHMSRPNAYEMLFSEQQVFKMGFNFNKSRITVFKGLLADIFKVHRTTF